MSKLASHWPFGHLQPKLWAKEGPGVKLPVWLLTTKSRESTFSRRLKRECNTALESSRRELQLWFKPCPNPSLGREVMIPQSPRSLNRDSFGTPPWESREKEPFECSLRSCGAAENTIRGKVVASPESGPWWVKWIRVSPWLIPTPNACIMTSNQLVLVLDAGSWPNSLISS
jgi:hypothetical protein